MTLWNKIVIGFKCLIADYEGALIYLLQKVLNPILSSESVEKNLPKVIAKCESIISYTYKLERYIPVCFENRFKVLRSAIESLCSALEDGVVSEDELKAIIEAIRKAKDAFIEEGEDSDEGIGTSKNLLEKLEPETK